jgi:hypothetical protein
MTSKTDTLDAITVGARLGGGSGGSGIASVFD